MMLQCRLPLHLAVGEGGRADIVALLIEADDSDTHLGHGNREGRTPVDAACDSNNEEVR